MIKKINLYDREESNFKKMMVTLYTEYELNLNNPFLRAKKTSIL